MSYWVYLVDDDGNEVSVPRHSEGGTYVVGGTDLAELNVTYNYSRAFAKTELESLRSLDGKPAGEMLPLLESAVKCLGVSRGEDYWAGTDGNAGRALSILVGWAKASPGGRFVVS